MISWSETAFFSERTVNLKKFHCLFSSSHYSVFLELTSWFLLLLWKMLICNMDRLVSFIMYYSKGLQWNLNLITLNTCCQQWRFGQWKILQLRNINHNFYPFHWEMKVYISAFLLPCSLCFPVSSHLFSRYNRGGTAEKKRPWSFLLQSHIFFSERLNARLAVPLLEHLTILCRTFESASFLSNISCSISQEVLKGMHP